MECCVSVFLIDSQVVRSFAIENQSEIFPFLSSLFRISILFNAYRYVCRMVVWGLPVRRLLFSQQVSILRGMCALDIRIILPSQLSCLLHNRINRILSRQDFLRLFK